jgi:hypothetical protein
MARPPSGQTAPTDPAGPEVLIVARDHDALCLALREAFAGQGRITVVVDRRRAARRRRTQPVSEERRCRERRRLPPAGSDLRVQDYVLVHPPTQRLSD